MIKKKSNRSKIFNEYIIEGISKANPGIPIEDIRYSVRNEVSTPSLSIADFKEYYNPEFGFLLENNSLSDKARRAEIEKYGNKIPYIKDKEIRLKKGIFNTGKISTNLLDSIYNSAERVGVPFEEALGLAGRESTLGIGRGFKEGNSISPTELMSNWQQVQDIINTNSSIERYNDIIKRYNNKEPLTEEDITFAKQYFKNEKREIDSTRPIEENPIDNALKYYREGNYNKNDSKHTRMVKEDGKTLMSEPAIQNWLKNKKSNKYSFGSWFKGATEDVKDWNKDVTENFMNSKFGQGLGNLGIKAGGLGGIANTAATAIGGLAAGGRSSAVGNAMQKVGSLASNIPGVGGLIGAGVNLLGEVVNGAFGSKLNAENIASVEGDIKQALNFTSNASDYDALASNYEGLQGVMGFDKDFIGKDGWIGGSKAKRKYNELKRRAEEAEQFQFNTLTNNAQNIADTNLQLLEANYSAYGGPIDMKYTGVMSPFGNQFKDGGIYIKPSKRGTFTAAAKKRGMGVQEFASKVLANKEDYSPAMVKKANFARNASKWKHDDGGPLDTRMELLRRLEEKRNRRGTYGGGKHGGAGAGSLFLESPDDFTLVKDTIWVPYRETFNDAFGRARAAGLDEFMFDNKAYTTELGDNPDNNRAGEERVIEGLLPVERTRQVKNKKAEGGELFTNGVVQINAGGLHSTNPYEGVQMGVDPQGIPNLVEEGEVVFNDYVFSNRLIVPNAVREKYKLRGNKEITFADAAKQMQKESEERPNDPISKRGLMSAMSRLQQEQEAVREEKPASQEGRQYAKGGKLGNLFAGPGEESQVMARAKAKRQGYDVGNSLEDYLESPVYEDTDRESNLTWLRYAPVVGSAIGLGQNLFSSPDYSGPNAILSAAESAGRYTPVGYSPIGNYLKYTPFDRDYYINKLNADTAASRRGLINTSGGNRAAAMAGILASDYNYGNQLGALARQAEEYNLAQRQAVEQFNRATNMTNAEMGLKAAMANQEAALNAGRTRLSGTAQAMAMKEEIAARRGASVRANLTNFFNSLGEIGREEYSRNMIMSNPALYYSIDSKGNITYKNGYEGLSEAEKKEVRTAASKAKSKKAKGGYLTIKKGGRHG